MQKKRRFTEEEKRIIVSRYNRDYTPQQLAEEFDCEVADIIRVLEERHAL